MDLFDPYEQDVGLWNDVCSVCYLSLLQDKVCNSGATWPDHEHHLPLQLIPLSVAFTFAKEHIIIWKQNLNSL